MVTSADGTPIDWIGEISSAALRSAKWSLLTRLAQISGGATLALILARWLTPEDYGIIAVPTLVLALVGLIHQVGLSHALVQRDSQVADAASVVFWLSVGLGVVVYAGLWVSAPAIARMFSEPRSESVLRLLGAQVLIWSMTLVPTSLLQRRFAFRELFWIQATASGLALVVAVPLARQGAGYWALVAGSLTGSVTGSVLTWRRTRWQPTATFDLVLARQLARFGVLATLEGILGWFLIWFDNVVVGKVLGSEALGVYSLAFNVAVFAVSVPISGLTGVSLATFSRLRRRPDAVRVGYLAGTRLIAAYAIPSGVGLALIAEPASRLVYGEAWRDLGGVLMVLALYAGIGHLWTLNTDAFKALGRPDVIPKIYLPLMCVTIPAYVVSAHYGLIAFTVTRACVLVLGAPAHTWAAVRLVGLPWSYLWSCCRSPCLAVLPMSIVTGTVLTMYSEGGPLGWGGLILAVCCAVITYLAALYLLDRMFVTSAVLLARRVFRSTTE